MRRGEWNLPEMRDVLDPEEYQWLWNVTARRRVEEASAFLPRKPEVFKGR